VPTSGVTPRVPDGARPQLYSPKKEPRKVVDEEATAKKQEVADKKAAEKGEESKPVSRGPDTTRPLRG
jgi:hypothetical protein